MASKLLIVHGYSDGSTSFTALGDFLVQQGVYRSADLYYLDYSSMDDEATFHDFADKLDTDHRLRLNGERVDVICHSTGSLVVRAWLALHAERNRRRRLEEDCPIDRLLCFAPANFGSDLAGLGQSFLGKFRTTFFNSNSRKSDFLESGKVVLRGLEPASPFQWELSFNYDLHGDSSYFSPKRKESQRCYPFVFSAGEAYGGVEAKLVKQRAMLGTDGTVRIAGTSLNTRGCSLDFRSAGPTLIWWQNTKFDHIPFAVFSGFNHGSIVNPATPGFMDADGPGAVALTILKGKSSTTLDEYAQFARTFDEVSERNYARMPDERKTRYQQFFFRVRDDVDHLVDDYFIDFYVLGRDNQPHEALTLKFDEDFESQVTTHSTTKSHRVVMMNCSKLGEFHEALKAEGAKLVLEVTGVSSLPDVRYMKSTFVAYDPDPAALRKGEPDLLYPNTTTLVDVILNRSQTDRLAVITGPTGAVVVTAVTAAEPPAEKTGRAALIPSDASGQGVGT
jgi:pimeloyl-ACP methyl ester carboxylesterase